MSMHTHVTYGLVPSPSNACAHKEKRGRFHMCRVQRSCYNVHKGERLGTIQCARLGTRLYVTLMTGLNTQCKKCFLTLISILVTQYLRKFSLTFVTLVYVHYMYTTQSCTCTYINLFICAAEWRVHFTVVLGLLYLHIFINCVIILSWYEGELFCERHDVAGTCVT